MMNVYGHSITAEQQAACLAAMKGCFRKVDVEAAALAAGVPEFANVGRVRPELLANRVADRLLQLQRKAGNIVRDGQYWLSR